MKQCIKCGKFFPIDKFYIRRDSNCKDKRRNVCKECTNKKSLEWRKKTGFSQTIYSRYWRKKNKNYRKKFSDKQKEYSKKYNSKNKRKIDIRTNSFLKINIDKNCFVCGKNNNLERHHYEYENYKSVIILCKNCHESVHRLNYDNLKEEVLKKYSYKILNDVYRDTCNFYT